MTKNERLAKAKAAQAAKRRRKREAERARLAANEWEHVEWRGQYGYTMGSVKS